MNNSLLSFLQGASVEEVKPGKRTGGGRAKQWQPAPSIVAIRLFRDGSVFPSQAAIEKFGLEYKKATITKEELPLKEGEKEAKTKNVYAFPDGTGNGFDVIDSRIWGQFKASGDNAMLFVIPTPKNAPKVDLFGTTNYEDDGTPKSTVAEQGAMTFGKEVLIPAVEQIYGIVFAVPAVEAKPAVAAKPAEGDKPAIAAKPAVEAVEAVEGVDYVDLAIFESLGTFNITETYSKKIMNIPKRVIRGERAGEEDYVRREDAKVYGFAPAAMVLADYTDTKKETTAAPKEELAGAEQ